MFCGAYAYAFIPPNVIGGPCTIGCLTSVMRWTCGVPYEHEHEDTSKHKEPHIIIYTFPNVHWFVVQWGASEHVDKHEKVYRGKRSTLSDAYSEDCNDEVVVFSKVEAGFLGIFSWGATYYNNLQLGHLACALAGSINETSTA
ncbi:hypothetical protein E2320_010806 [Naja naja]|nr:hypothetical protein E2320_010806 [Naja naja]